MTPSYFSRPSGSSNERGALQWLMNVPFSTVKHSEDLDSEDSIQGQSQSPINAYSPNPTPPAYPQKTKKTINDSAPLN